MDATAIEQRFLSAYDEYADALFRHCYFRMGDREIGKELMQETYMKAWEYIAKGNAIEDLRAFLYKTANNLIVDYLRRKSKRTEQSFEDMQEEGFDIPAAENTKRDTEIHFSEQQVTVYLQNIKEPYRSALIMRYIDDLSPAEIATALGISANVASVRINRGLEKLRSQLDNDG